MFVLTSLTRVIWPLIALIALLAFNWFFTPGFSEISVNDGRYFGSLIDILDRGALVLLLALGMTLVIATGGVDLSVGAVMAISGTVAAWGVAHGWSFPVAFLAAIAAGFSAGLFNGMFVTILKLQPIVATLIIMVAGRGVAQLISNGNMITFDNPAFVYLGSGYWLGFPIAIWIALLAFTLTGIIVRFTALGLLLEAAGGNPVATRFTGIRVGTITTGVYIISGCCAAMAGILATADIQAADANNTGLYYELDAILAVVIGGTALAGGRFTLIGSVIGALIIQSLTTTILSRGVEVHYTLVVKAVVILLVCVLQSSRLVEWAGRMRRKAT